MWKNSYILLIVMGFFLIPLQSYACKSHSNKSVTTDKECCCKSKEKHTKKSSKKCCTDKENKDKDGDCSKECGNKSCQNSSRTTFSGIFLTNTEPQHTVFKIKKSYPPYIQSDYSTDYSSFWQPPKIS